MAASDFVAPEWKLKPHPIIPRHRKPCLVVVMDGIGEGPKDQYDAVFSAFPPTMNHLASLKPKLWRTVLAHGKAVGLPSDADMGNSEVGHNALGAGRIIKQGAGLVDAALKSGLLQQGEGWQYLKAAFTKPGATFHTFGLLSDGGVHSRFDQMAQIVHIAAQDGAKKIRVHPLFDGRDVQDGTSVKFAAELEALLTEVGQKYGVDAKIASGGGRMKVTMDRYDADWCVIVLFCAILCSSASFFSKQLSTSILTFTSIIQEHCQAWLGGSRSGHCSPFQVHRRGSCDLQEGGRPRF